MADYDLVIRKGRIIDGTGSPWYYGDIGIKDEKIKAIGKVDPSSAERIIEADKLAVAPGFIDMHNHSDLILVLSNHAEILAPFIGQGITTLVTGNCGISTAPVNEESVDIMKRYVGALGADSVDWNWSTFDDYLTRLENQGVLFNVSPLVGHGAIRFAVMGAKATEPNHDEMEAMKALLDRTMKEGAFGMSVGLIYPPGMWSSTEELIELAKIVAKYSGVFTSHVRGSSEIAVSAERELIEIGEKSKVRLQRSHHEACGMEHWDKVLKTMEMEEEARKRGVDIASDVIPYPFVNTSLNAVFPPWALEGGVDKLIERLENFETREKIKKDIEEVVPSWPEGRKWLPGSWSHNLAKSFGWQNIYVLSAANTKNKKYEGRNLTEISDAENTDPFEVAVKLTIEGGGNVLALYIGVTGDLQNERYLHFLLKHRLSAICLDAALTGKGVPHPGAHGGFPRLLGRYSREQKLFPIEEAVRKITSLPASRIVLTKRGILREGMFADITVFNPETIIDKGTHLKPEQKPQGIEYVLINGKVVFEKGEYHKEGLSGKVLRKYT